ncbi:MAG: hypothetical protein Q9169_008563 [Polycauliona sp. 2 TL-2023]
MTPPPEQYYGFFPGKYTTAYLESYIDNHTYSGQTIRDRISFNAHVSSITQIPSNPSTPNGANWEITYNSSQKIQTCKLIDATGMTSRPHIPTIPGSSSFTGKTLHHKSFGQSQSLLISDPSIRNIAIIGGAKSAADVAYALAKSALPNRKIHWIIREEGNGPSAFFAAPAMTARYANSNEGFYNRFLASFLPNRFGNRWGWLKWLLQRTVLGRWYAKRLWDGFDAGLRAFHDYQREEGKENGFANLEYDTPIFWQNDSSGVCNHPDFLSTIARNVQIHRRNISHLSPSSITLSPSPSATNPSPLTLPIDAIVYCTGWSPLSPLYSPSQATSFGLPVPLSSTTPETQSHWNTLETTADAAILTQLPTLATPPPYRKIAPTHTPFRLYRAIAPASDRTHSIVFLGKIVVGNNFRIAEAQALWSVAYLNNLLPSLLIPSQKEVEIAETVAWNRRRYLNKGELGSWFYYDVVDYSDALIEQLGLVSHRQGNKGWMGDLLEPCFAADMRGLVGEFKGKYMR